MIVLLSAALAGSFPTHDSPFRSGARSPDDAAVVIGIEDYFVLPDVPHAERDAAAVEDLLIYTVGVPSDRVERVSAPASKERIEEALDRAKGLVGSEGTLWVYFAGHGAASPSTGDRVLLGADTLADASSFEARSLSIPDLKGRLHGAGARTVLMVDACYSGASRGGNDLLPGKRFAVPSYAVPDEAGWIEWHAAQPDQMSGPLDVAEHGAFTWAMIGALRGWADGQIDDQPDGQVTVEEADLYVREVLRLVEVRDQQPVLNASDTQTVLQAADTLEPRPNSASLREQLERPAPAPVPVAPVPEQVVDTAPSTAPFQNTTSEKVGRCTRKKRGVPVDYPPGSEFWKCTQTTELIVTDAAELSAEEAHARLVQDPKVKLKAKGTLDWTFGGTSLPAHWIRGRGYQLYGFITIEDPRSTSTYQCRGVYGFDHPHAPEEWCRDKIAALIDYRARTAD